MNLPFSQPLEKVSFGALAAATVVVLTWALKEFAGVDLPGEVQAALSVLFGYIVSYAIPLTEEEAEAIARKFYKG